ARQPAGCRATPSLRGGECFLILPFNHSNRPEPCDARRKACAMNNLNHGFDILVSVRFLFRKPLSSQGLNYDTAGLQFLLNFLRSDPLFRGGPAQYAAGTMACSAEGLMQGGFLA